MTDGAKKIKVPAGPSLKSLKFMVVEDDDHMRELIIRTLKGIGAKNVAQARDGGEALSLFDEYVPDIVITDWKMAPVDGIELVKRIRAGIQGISPYTPVIMLTVHTERMRIVRARDAGVNEFVAKPVTVRTLYARIRVLIEEPRHFVRTDTYFGPDRRRKQLPIKHKNRRVATPWLVKVQPPGSAAADQ